MARRSFRKALASLIGGEDLAQPVARDHVVPDDASAMFANGSPAGIGHNSSVLVNRMTQLGTEQDASSWNRYVTQRFLNRGEHFALGRNGLARVALGKIGDTATGKGWETKITDPAVPEDQRPEIARKVAAYETKLGIQKVLPRALFRGRQYGDALILLGILDGRSADQPVDLGNLQTIKWAVVIDRRHFDYAAVGGPKSDEFGEPTLYRITDLDGILDDGVRFFGGGTANLTHEQLFEFYNTGADLVVHADRVLRFPTEDALSILDTIQDSFAAFLETTDGVKKAASEASVLNLKIDKWAQKSWHDNGGTLGLQRLREMVRGKSSLNAIVTDKGTEEVGYLSRAFSGLDKLVGPPMVWLAASLRTPITELFGVSPTGWGQGESERATYHGTAVDFQAQHIEGPLTKLHGYILVAKDGGILLASTTQREILFADLSPPDEETRSNLRTASIDDATKAFEANGITREEYRAFLSAVADESELFPLTLQVEEKKDQAPEAPVGVWTGITTMLQAAYPAGIPIEVLGAVIPLLSPERFTPEITAAALAAPPPGLGALPGPGTEAPELGTEAPELGTAVLGEPGGEEDAVDPHVAAWESGKPPADAAEAKVIAAELGVPTVRITREARNGRIKSWGVLGGKPRHSRAEVERLIMEENDTAPPQKLGLMVPVPDDLAQQFPNTDGFEPHVTMLFVGEVGAKDRARVSDIARDVLAASPVSQGSAELGDVEYFEQPDEDQRVAYAAVKFTPDLTALHKALKKAIEDAGVEVKHFDGPFTPHATLDVVPTGEEFTGTPPAGSWDFDELVLWWGDQREAISLAPPVETL